MNRSAIEDSMLVEDVTRESLNGKSLFDRFGGRPTLDKVHKIFYDKLFAHQWLSQFFAGVNQTHIENQQSDFFSQLTGGPKNYSGRMPNHAHLHIYITEELYTTRNNILRESLEEAGVPEKEREEWLKIDLAFRRVMEKKSPADCVKRYADEDVVIIPNPLNRWAS